MKAELTRNLPVGKGRIGFKVSNYFPVPVGKLWDAITLGRQMERFFIDKVEGDFTRDMTPVFFTWKQCGRYAVWPTVFQEGKKLEFRWANGTRYLTTVTMTLKKKAHYVELEIHERGWKPADLDNAFGKLQRLDDVPRLPEGLPAARSASAHGKVRDDREASRRVRRSELRTVACYSSPTRSAVDNRLLPGLSLRGIGETPYATLNFEHPTSNPR